MAKLWILLLFFVSSSWAVKDTFSVIDKLRHDLIVLKDLPISQREGRDVDKDETLMNIFNIYDEFNEKINDASLAIGKRHLNALNSLWLWAITQKDMNIVEGMYTNFLQKLHGVTKGFEPLNKNYWMTFADVVLTHPNVSVPVALRRISDAIVEQNLFISAYKEASSQICDERQSPQQLLYNLYNIITATEIKGYMMMQFSYTFLRLYNNGTFKDEGNKTLRDYETRVSETIRAVRTAMAFAPRDLWRCDPPPKKHKEGETYAELKQLFQGYIVNEVDLNPSSSCLENCAYYSYSKVHGCYDNQYCAQQRRCNGKVLNCQYVDSDMWICPSKNSNRRYEYIEYENGRTLGNKGTCKRSTTKVDSWWRWLFWHCSYCMCLCDDHNSSSDRYFNLRDVTSDILDNKVITGIRLVKENQIIHIQIQQGELLERGQINEASVSWKRIDNFTILDRNVMNGRDFHTLSWEKRAIDLDDLIAPEEHVLTGARFRMVGAHLNFEIRVTPFNFTSGKLIKPMEKSTWISNDNTDVNDPSGFDRRTEFIIQKPDIPTRTQAPTFPDSKSNQFLNFGPTDMDKDAAQTTIPFIDIQPVETNPSFPLAGAGIFHKGRDGYGGYVAVKVITYDITNHIHAEVPTPPPIIGWNNIPANK